jgi:8-oxo-dGTP pyrophosphatase MutT (NUDIX family)
LAEPGLSPRTALAIHLAAVRETFEECEVLLAPSIDAARIDQARLWLREGMSMIEIAQRLQMRFALDTLVPLSRWITPKVPSLTRKRFDTRFFLAVLPPGQSPLSSSSESESGRWFAARDALAAHWRAEVELAPPQLMTLALLARFERTEAVLANVRARPPVLIEPHPMQRDGTRVVAYPGDPEHPVSVRAMPGPTRLIYANGRFVPLGGYDDWFA